MPRFCLLSLKHDRNIVELFSIKSIYLIIPIILAFVSRIWVLELIIKTSFRIVIMMVLWEAVEFTKEEIKEIIVKLLTVVGFSFASLNSKSNDNS